LPLINLCWLHLKVVAVVGGVIRVYQNGSRSTTEASLSRSVGQVGLWQPGDARLLTSRETNG